MAGWRHERVAEMVHQELAVRLRRDIKDPDLTDLSITRVEVTKDLSRATVWYLPLGGGDVSPELAAAVERAGRQLRGPVGRALRLRTAPELVFQVDHKLEEAVRITSLLDQIGRERRAAADDAAEGEE